MTILHRTNVEIFQSGLGLQRTIVSMIDRISLYKMKNIVKKAHHNLPEPKVTSSNCFFCPTNSPNPNEWRRKSSKSSHLRSRNQQVFHVSAWKWTKTTAWLLKIAGNYFSLDGVTVAPRPITASQNPKVASPNSLFCLATVQKTDRFDLWRQTTKKSKKLWHRRRWSLSFVSR